MYMGVLNYSLPYDVEIQRCSYSFNFLYFTSTLRSVEWTKISIPETTISPTDRPYAH